MSVRRKSYRSWPIIGNVRMAKGFAPDAVHHVRKVEVILRCASLVVLVPLLLHVGSVSAQESYRTLCGRQRRSRRRERRGSSPWRRVGLNRALLTWRHGS